MVDKLLIIVFQDYFEKSPVCHGAGTLKCGICECDSMHFGRTCECDANNNRHGNDTDMVSGCRLNNDSEINCSGRGECNCGQCECQARTNPEEVKIVSFNLCAHNN